MTIPGWAEIQISTLTRDFDNCTKNKEDEEKDLQKGILPRSASLISVPRCSLLPGIIFTLGFSSAQMTYLET